MINAGWHGKDNEPTDRLAIDVQHEYFTDIRKGEKDRIRIVFNFLT